jgi:hypothetical protein
MDLAHHESGAMRKLFAGVRLRRLREERGLSQISLAEQLGLSPSYVNQLEKNQRPLTVPVLLKINAVFGVDVQLFAEGEEARLIADLREIFADPALGETVSLSEIREIASSMPAVGRSVVALGRRLRHAGERAEAMAQQLGLGAGGLVAAGATMPYEQVRDFFYRRHNHVAELDDSAERLSEAIGLIPGRSGEALDRRLRETHGVRIETVAASEDAALRRWLPDERRLILSDTLSPGRRAFQMATQIAFLEEEAMIERLAGEAAGASRAAHALARIGLSAYYAAALLMPYGRFRAAAEEEAYDLDRLAGRFGVGFETICHRVSSLQRPGAAGVPFFFVRVDRAGNISKRQSATDFHFSRVGGSCPLWNVYEAFARPGEIVRQIALMPDGRTYLWIARAIRRPSARWGAPSKIFSIGLGCDIAHAGRLIYARGLDLDDNSAATPIGAGCKVCERSGCAQRAFPMIGRPLAVDETRATTEPYGSA